MAFKSNTKRSYYLRYIIAFISTIFVINVNSLPEAGKATLELSQDEKFAAFKKILFKETKVEMTGICTSSNKPPPRMIIQWKLKYSTCTEKFLNIKPSQGAFAHVPSGEIIGDPKEVSCAEINHVSITDLSKWNEIKPIKVSERQEKNVTEKTGIKNQHNTTAKSRRSSDLKNGDKQVKKEDKKVSLTKKKNTPKKTPELITPWSGAYMLIIKVYPVEETMKFNLKIKVDMKGKRGYLSATEWPLLPFFGVLSLVYLFYAIGWFSAACYNWRDLLRIQFWIGAVIALGMLEKALFYSEYQNVNITGEESDGLVIFAELVSCLKRTLARILVIIVSMGFGIVKPRLGAALPKVLAAGLLFFILASIEGCLRALSPKASPSKQQMIAAIPLVVLDSILCWWIFTALVQTTRTLRIRKNLVKLSLYRHFTNTLIFAVVASVIYMAWSIRSHTFSGCTDWSEVWLDEAFWPFLFSLILLVIMILWRPTNNNQRYAFTPLVDYSDDEQDDPALSDAFDGMKLRSMRNESNGNLKNRTADEDLKWVEENIPSIPTTVLPSLDSDEEIMTTKLEMSKME